MQLYHSALLHILFSVPLDVWYILNSTSIIILHLSSSSCCHCGYCYFLFLPTSLHDVTVRLPSVVTSGLSELQTLYPLVILFCLNCSAHIHDLLCLPNLPWQLSSPRSCHHHQTPWFQVLNDPQKALCDVCLLTQNITSNILYRFNLSFIMHHAALQRKAI